ncbi:hypothetical protein P389DRAFT_12776 [Cystobasidium minutum MCA 4210]|uniref:uncharacterized protein n=1 Tax=Cystobasidium minutum MCA 4210 TaxID=1397322 RepID=UPI0034CF31C8|eukprot:jgi/Rhomi1/12776/CE12775_202
MKEHEQQPVNSKVRAAREQTDWSLWKKRILFKIPGVQEGMAVPFLLLSQIIEPIFIAVCQTHVAPKGLQFNVFDCVGYEAKASILDIVKEFSEAVRLSNTTRADGSAFMSPKYEDDQAWEDLLGPAFNHALAGGYIRHIVTGRHRWRVTAELPRPHITAYLTAPAIFFKPNRQPTSTEEALHIGMVQCGYKGKPPKVLFSKVDRRKQVGPKDGSEGDQRAPLLPRSPARSPGSSLPVGRARPAEQSLAGQTRIAKAVKKYRQYNMDF